MNGSSSGARRMTRTRLTAQARELMLTREAIALVAAGGSSRVVVAGIRFGESILDDAQRLALEAGVRVKPIRRAGGIGADLLVEPIS
jgi:hypothetical protein